MAAKILELKGDYPLIKINGNPNSESAAITAALSSMGISSIIYGAKAIDDDGEEYIYKSQGGGTWKKTSHGPA